MNPQVDAYLKSAKKWRQEMENLRKIILELPLNEELKWGKPCYTFQGSNIVVIVGFTKYCSLIFAKGVLLKDAKRVLIKPSENTQAARQMRFTTLQETEEIAPTLKAYLREAIELEKAGLEVTYKTVSEFKMPEEFQKKLDASPALQTAFKALTPGRQRGYLLHFSEAKQAKTRESRIEKSTPQILKGKGLGD